MPTQAEDENEQREDQRIGDRPEQPPRRAHHVEQRREGVRQREPRDLHSREIGEVADRDQRQHDERRRKPCQPAQRGAVSARAARRSVERRRRQQQYAEAEILESFQPAPLALRDRWKQRAVARIGRVPQRVERHREIAIGAGDRETAARAEPPFDQYHRAQRRDGGDRDPQALPAPALPERHHHRAGPDRRDHHQQIAVDQRRHDEQRGPVQRRAAAPWIGEQPQGPQDQPVREQIGVDVAVQQRRRRGEQRNAAPQAERIGRISAQQQPREPCLQEQAQQHPRPDQLRIGRQQAREGFRRQRDERIGGREQDGDALGRVEQGRARAPARVAVMQPGMSAERILAIVAAAQQPADIAHLQRRRMEQRKEERDRQQDQRQTGERGHAPALGTDG